MDWLNTVLDIGGTVLNIFGTLDEAESRGKNHSVHVS